MTLGSPELTNVLLGIMGFGWTLYGLKLDKRLTRLETLHQAHHKDEGPV